MAEISDVGGIAEGGSLLDADLEDFHFNDSAATKAPEWFRLLGDAGEDVGEPDPVLSLMYGMALAPIAGTEDKLEEPVEEAE